MYVWGNAMPIVKAPKKRQPLWKEWDKAAQKEGVRAPVYAVNGDVYTGEWSDNKKHGMVDTRGNDFISSIPLNIGLHYFSFPLLQGSGLSPRDQ